MEHEILTLPEVAKYLKVSRNTVYRLVRREAIPVFRVTKRGWRFDRDKIAAWLVALEKANNYGKCGHQTKTI
jgi:excisionase family DNA binding protein